ncbi:MAG: ROK family protein, partial [Verrucomicrobiota bacterium]
SKANEKRSSPAGGADSLNILGIDIGGTKLAVCLGNEKGDVFARQKMPARSEEGPEQGLNRMAEAAQALLAGRPPGWVDAIGISAPGPLSLRTGSLLDIPNMPGWVDVPVVSWFEERFAKPVFMNNDANGGALAEFLFGQHRGTEDLVFLTLSTGIGAGVISGGRIVQGATDGGGEIGHHTLNPKGPPCPCGRRGCLEIYCGGRNVAERVRQHLADHPTETSLLEAGDRLDFKAIAEAARAGDRFARSVWDEFTEHLAHGIGNVIMMFNPSFVLLGTIAIHTGDFLLHPLREALPRYAWSSALEGFQVLPASIGENIGDLAALAIATEQLKSR